MSLIESVQQAVAEKDFEKLEDLWTEMVLDTEITLDTFFDIAKTLKESNESERAFFLLEIYASHLASIKEYNKAIKINKNMLYYCKKNAGVRKSLIDLYKKSYSKSEHLSEYIEMSGLGKEEPIFKAIGKLEEFLRYDVGKYFYFERYGIGEVIDVISSKKEIIIDFEKKKRHFLTLDVAHGLLTPIHKEHFLYKKEKNIDDLRKMAMKKPLELTKMILKHFQEPLTSSQIKLHLERIIDKQKLHSFWEKTRKGLEKDKNIQITGRTAKTYTYSETDLNQEELALMAFSAASIFEKYLLAVDYAEKMPEVFKKIVPDLVETGNKIYQQQPALALDILMFCNDHDIEAEFVYTIETILDIEDFQAIIHKMKSSDHQKLLLCLLKEKNPTQWPTIFKTLAFSLGDHKVLDGIAEQLKDVPDTLQDIYRTIFSVPKQYPLQFQWMLKKMQRGEFREYTNPSFIPRLIESLDYVKGIKGIVNKILNLKDFDKILKNAKEEDAQRILEKINNSTGLEGYKKKDFLRIIEYHFPLLFAEDIDIIYATEAALNKKKKELDRILTIEIPENKKEISRAREFGDLSDNFEYKAAKERQDQLYQKVKIIESSLSEARIIDPNKIKTSCVEVGTKITLKNMQDQTLINYTILGRWDIDLKNNIISNEAPVSKRLIGKTSGEKTIINKTEYEIVKIERGI